MIVWVKLREGKIYLSHGYYLMHSYEICLIGYKCPMGDTVEYISKVSNNLLFANIRKKSQKPEELYDLIDMMMPGSKKCEIFARNNNLRPGWFSLGNQLGEQFDKWVNQINCDLCEQPIKTGTKRYKAKRTANIDVCQNCFKTERTEALKDYFELENDINEDVLHHYHRCNQCNIDPIWGTRFSCVTCDNYDLCEACYDKNLENQKTEDDEHYHDVNHEWIAYEQPKLAAGLPAHLDSKCNACFQKPIIGVCFKCSECTHFSLCQNCFFIKDSIAFKNLRGHKSDHNFEMFIEASNDKKNYQCHWCELSFNNNIYKCENCFNFYFCEKCFIKRENYTTNMATTHKKYHKFIKLLN